MTRILVMSETLPLAEIMAHLSEIVDRVERVICLPSAASQCVDRSYDEACYQ